jgi:hypothetical protein
MKKAKTPLVYLVAAVVLMTFASRPVLAKPRAQKMLVMRAVTDFLSSVELATSVHDFDHDADGQSDLYVYPLLTTSPDLATKYVTLQEALGSKRVVLKESPQVTPSLDNPPGTYPIVAQIGYGGGSGSYYPRGGMLGGGWQSRGFMSGGMMGYGGGGYYGGGRGNYGGGYRGYSERPLGRPQAAKPLALTADEVTDLGGGRRQPNPAFGAAAEPRQVQVGALCFEKWRLIAQSRFRGDPEFFGYVGLASPQIRKELLTWSNQTNIHIAIEKELLKLGVASPTKALIDELRSPVITDIVSFYQARSPQIVGRDKGISGILVTDRHRILCADVYSSPELFVKMLPQLMQSAALGVCGPDKARGRVIEKSEVEKFVDELRQVEMVKRETPQSYRLIVPKIVSGAVPGGGTRRPAAPRRFTSHCKNPRSPRGFCMRAASPTLLRAGGLPRS